MFKTDECFAYDGVTEVIQAAWGEVGTNYYAIVERTVNSYWFMVRVPQWDEDDLNGVPIMSTSYFVDRWGAVASILDALPSHGSKYSAVWLCTPEPVQTGGDPQIYRLCEVWEGNEPDEPRQRSVLFVTSDGRRITHSLLCTPEDRLENLHQIFLQQC